MGKFIDISGMQKKFLQAIEDLKKSIDALNKSFLLFDKAVSELPDFTIQETLAADVMLNTSINN